MDKAQIAQIASQMSTKEDLLTLLNRIKQEKLHKLGYDVKFYPFTMRHLLYYCNPNHSFHRYRKFKIKKKSGGFRQITVPRNQSFKLLLQAVNEILKSMYIPTDYAMGFTEGRSVVSNAKVHMGQNYIFNIDLKDFFPSVEQPRIWKRLQLAPFNFSMPIANVLAGLCSMRESRKDIYGKDSLVYVLPQGAPTSPIITNMICDTLDRRLAGLAKRFGLHYTRYADDITFSSMHHVYAANGDFWKELIRIINDQGFTINDAKTRLQKSGGRQEVTGIIVSKKLNVTKKYVREIRSLLYIWEKYGYIDTISRFLPKYKEEKGHVKKGNSNLINILDGKLMYLKMVKGDTDAVYMKLNKKFNELIAKARDTSKTTEQHITYVETISTLEFEKKFNTEITISYSKEPTVYATAKEDTRVFKPHRYAWFIFAGKKTLASINKNIKKEEESHKELLYISLCFDGRNKNFWLIHKQNKVVKPFLPPVDIDKLNNDLDSLINEQNG